MLRQIGVVVILATICSARLVDIAKEDNSTNEPNKNSEGIEGTEATEKTCIFETDSDSATILPAVSSLTAHFYKDFATQIPNKNFIYSPMAIELGIQVLNLGVQGTSHEEIVNVMHVDVQNPVTAGKIKQLIADTTNKNNGYSLEILNQLDVLYNYPIRESYRIKAQDIFSAKIQPVNFKGEAKSDLRIKNIGDRIKDENKLKIVLLNDFIFNAGWTFPFNARNTEKDEFTFVSDLGIQEIVDVDIMTSSPIELEYGYSTDLNAEILRLPLAGNNASLVIILPDKLENFAALEFKADSIFVKHILTKQLTIVKLPRFFLRSPEIDYKTTLKNLGIKSIFNESTANFKRLSSKYKTLFVSDIYQTAAINITEAGIKAETGGGSHLMEPAFRRFVPPSNPIVFNVNHSFIFFLEIQQYVGFAGRILKPVTSDPNYV